MRLPALGASPHATSLTSGTPTTASRSTRSHGTGRRRSGFASADPPCRDTYVHGMAIESRVFRHARESTHLARRPDHHVDVNDAGEADRHVRTETNAGRLEHARFNGVTRDVHVGANDHVVAELQQVVI